MAWESAQKAAWALAKRQHWVITRRQLVGLGFTPREVDLRIERGRLHPAHAGVYAVGRPHLTRSGTFVAAVLACGPHALLSHDSAAELYGIRPKRPGPIHVTVPPGAHPRRRGIKAHRRGGLRGTRRDGIPITTIVDTLIDLACSLPEPKLERAVNEAVNRDLTDPERLRRALPPGRRGAPTLARLLDRDTFVVTDSRLEQRLLRIARAAGLPKPETQVRHGGGRVDFYWPGLIVEADSLRFHRTPFQQRADRLRDQQHQAAGLRTLRFTHWQIWHEPEHVESILRAVVARLAA
jgi:very-short-patch-repair endonuclease